jgi:hypothetical protein
MELIKYVLIGMLAVGCGASPEMASVPLAGPAATDPTSVATPTPLATQGPSQSPGIVPEGATPMVSPTPTASPLPPATLDTFIFQNSIGICNALKNWDPVTTSIQFPSNAGGTFLYTFTAQGVTIENGNGTNQNTLAVNSPVTIVKAGPINNPPVCTITVNDGQLVSVL